MFTNQMTAPQFEKLFPSDDACKSYLVARRWPKGVICPRCGNSNVDPVANKPFHWQCSKYAAAGGYRFSVLTGTIFEDTNVDMRTWFRTIHMMLTANERVSALQIHRTLVFGSYRTAWNLCHCIRAALADPEFRNLMGIVEVDELRPPPAPAGCDSNVGDVQLTQGDLAGALKSYRITARSLSDW